MNSHKECRIGLCFDEGLLRHRVDRPSLENPERIRGLYAEIERRYNGRYRRVPVREATAGEIAAVHSSLYLEQIRDYCQREDPYGYDPDTYLMEASLDTAALAAGGCLALAEEIAGGGLDRGYAVVRPPGHHAEPGRGMGFCVLNNVGICARYLQARFGFERLLIVDFDVHHGNGTQEIFSDEPGVLYLSLHQMGLFPGTGGEDDVGGDRGSGYTVNVPVHPQFGDGEYTCLLGRLLQAVVEQYLPQMILVSAGYDGHRDDTISGVQLSSGWYGTACTMLRQHAAECCDDRLLFILEGGYNPASLQEGVLATLDSLMEPRPPSTRVGIPVAPRAERLLRKHPLRSRWNIL